MSIIYQFIYHLSIIKQKLWAYSLISVGCAMGVFIETMLDQTTMEHRQVWTKPVVGGPHAYIYHISELVLAALKRGLGWVT